MVNITLALRTTKYLDKELEFMPWETARNHLYHILLTFDRSEVYGPTLVCKKKKKKVTFFTQNRLKVISNQKIICLRDDRKDDRKSDPNQ